MKHLKLLFTALLLLCNSVASAHDFEVDGIFYKITDATNKTVDVNYKGDRYDSFVNEYTGSIVIPETVTYDGTTYSVTGIGGYAFHGCVGLTSIVIPNSVTAIGICAFFGCSQLVDIEIPNSITSINQPDVFLGTIWYKNLPDGIVYIGKVLYKYKGTMPENTAIVIPEGIVATTPYAFSYCEGLTAVIIPTSLTDLGYGTFAGCNSLTDIIVRNGNPKYDSRENCNAVVETATNKLVAGCKSTIIPNSVTRIGSMAFWENTALTSIEIPNSVSVIDGDAFRGCTSLSDVTFPASVISIGSCAFLNCESFLNIRIPSTVQTIGGGAFSGCIKATSIVVDDENPYYDSRENCNAIIKKSTKTLISGCHNSFIPDGIRTIGMSAFSNLSELKNIEIPNSVTSIEGWSFENCSGLTSIDFPDELTDIGYAAFARCTGLSSVTIPAKVRELGDFAFTGCSGLESIYMKCETPPVIDEYTFQSVKATLYVPYGTRGAYQSVQYWKKFTDIVEQDPTEMTITVNGYGYGTYCSPYALDFSEVEGLNAYSAIGFNSATDVVTLARVMTTAAQAGIFVKGEPGTYKVPVVDECNEHTLNLFVGTLEESIVNSTDGSNSNYEFLISMSDGAPMFQQFADNSTLAAGQAYLQIPTAWLPATPQKSLSVRFEESETTGVEELKSENGNNEGVYYDLSGRAVENPTSGIYILNGKKVFIK